VLIGFVCRFYSQRLNDVLDLPLETFNALVEEISTIVKLENGSDPEAEETTKIEGKTAWSLATRILPKGKAPPPSMR